MFGKTIVIFSNLWETVWMQFKGNTDEGSARYWDDLAEVYQKETRISTTDFHYGPLLPGDSTLQLLPSIGNWFRSGAEFHFSSEAGRRVRRH